MKSASINTQHERAIHSGPDYILIISYLLSFFIAAGLVTVEYYQFPPLISVLSVILASFLILSTNWNIALLVLSVVCFLPNMQFNMVVGITGITAPNIVCAVTLIRLFAENPQSAKQPWPWHHPMWKRVFVAYLGLMLIRCFGYIRSDDVLTAFRLGTGYLRNITVFMAAFRALNKGVTPKKLLYMVSFLTLPICSILIFSGTTALTVTTDYSYIRYSFPFDANGACFIADLLWITSFGFILTVHQYTKRAIALAFMVIAGLAILFTFSRGGQITVLVGTLVLPFAIKKKQAVIFGITPLIIVFIFWLPSLFLERWKHTLQNPDEVTSVYDSGSRAQTILSTWEITQSNLLFGLGGRRYMEHVREIYSYSFRTHNHYIELIAESGILCLGIYLFLIYFLARNLFILWKSARTSNYILPYGILGIWFLMMLVFNFGGGISFAMNRIVPIILLFAGVAYHYMEFFSNDIQRNRLIQHEKYL